MRRFSKELMGTLSIPIILSILDKADSYGYEIMNKVRSLSDKRIQWKVGSIYPILQKLEAKGLIRSYWDMESNLRPRKYYTISKLGKAVLKDEKEDWALMNDIFLQLWNS